MVLPVVSSWLSTATIGLLRSVAAMLTESAEVWMFPKSLALLVFGFEQQRFVEFNVVRVRRLWRFFLYAFVGVDICKGLHKGNERSLFGDDMRPWLRSFDNTLLLVHALKPGFWLQCVDRRPFGTFLVPLLASRLSLRASLSTITDFVFALLKGEAKLLRFSFSCCSRQWFFSMLLMAVKKSESNSTPNVESSDVSSCTHKRKNLSMANSRTTTNSVLYCLCSTRLIDCTVCVALQVDCTVCVVNKTYPSIFIGGRRAKKAKKVLWRDCLFLTISVGIKIVSINFYETKIFANWRCDF